MFLGAMAATLGLQPERAVVSVHVTNPQGMAVVGAACAWLEDTLDVRTDAEGICRLPAPIGARYTLRVRALGYAQATASVEVTTLRQNLEVPLALSTQRLPTITTSASQRGVIGYVYSAVDGTPVEGADVRVLGTGMYARSDSAGKFLMMPKPGVQVLRIGHRQYYSHLASVDVLQTEGTTVTVWLRSIRERDPKEIVRQARLFDLQQRLLRQASLRFNTFGRQDIQRLNSSDLRRIVQFLTAEPPPPDACARIDGGPDWAPLWTIDPNEVELLETASPDRRTQDRRDNRGPTANACRYVVWKR